MPHLKAMPKFKFTATKLENILDDYAKIREQTIPDAVVANARLLCVELARRTQPFGADNKAKLAGEGRTEKDIGKIIKTGERLIAMSKRVNAEKIRGRLLSLVSGGRFDVVERIFSNIGFLKTWGGMEIISGDAINSIHQAARSSTTGRTKSRGTKLTIAKQGELDSYIAGVIKRVGLTKAGWAECAKQLPQVVQGSMTRGIPRWVTRNSGSGSVQDNSRNASNPYVQLTNSTPWASQVIPESEIASAKAVVITKMIQQMKRILKYRETEIA
jgi:hypothetical protein